ncbi:MAG: TIR domain-containing protein [Marinobacter sp.]|uniref:TIR domain-containing protein n=1 Tax=Marinobacter sp. TaxID=50741 RepID=UPI0034A0879A
MDYEFLSPLTISFIWHPFDRDAVDPIVDQVRGSFARDASRPFSRSLNIPLFFYSSLSPNTPPQNLPVSLASKNLIFVFTSVNTMGFERWTEYVEKLGKKSGLVAVPVAIDREGLSHEGSLAGVNCLRAFDWAGPHYKAKALVALSHEVYRFGFAKPDIKKKGKDSSITLFLSHAKRGGTGLRIAQAIKELIDESNLKRFFDATEIAPGFSFSAEIERHIPESTLIAISSDEYSSRYWCQREVLYAKRCQRPIVVVDCLEDYEDRVFPASSNVPCVHVSPDESFSKRDILRILNVAILETIRHEFALQSLQFCQKQGWIPADCLISPRPPEVRQVLSLADSRPVSICYPEPPIYEQEGDWLSGLNCKAFTPLWNEEDRDCFKSLRAGISISEVLGDGFSMHHLHGDQLIRLAQDVARHLLSRSAILLYGGDLRKNGFTEFVLDEAGILKDRLPMSEPLVENHLAWPLYVSSADIVAWRARHRNVMLTVQHDVPEDVALGIDKEKFLEPHSGSNRFVWSRCLTEMREKSVSSSDIRIFAGGKTCAYLGKMPGVLEEFLIAMRHKKPTFLLGGFGGVVAEICELLETGKGSGVFDEQWQVANNAGYQELQSVASRYRLEADYSSIVNSIVGLDLAEISLRSGLEKSEYLRLMKSPFPDECVHLVLKGLRDLDVV